jgi:hypothetical protein
MADPVEHSVSVALVSSGGTERLVMSLRDNYGRHSWR